MQCVAPSREGSATDTLEWRLWNAADLSYGGYLGNVSPDRLTWTSHTGLTHYGLYDPIVAKD
jgi:hypothetical protein